MLSAHVINPIGNVDVYTVTADDVHNIPFVSFYLLIGFEQHRVFTSRRMYTI